jgi:foldase protein PrsA
MVLIEGNRDDRVDPKVREAVFGAPRGALGGPLKTDAGHYVFQVTKISPPTDQSLAEAKANIRQFLTLRRQKEAVEAFFTDLGKKWKARTDCREGYVIQDCRNAPPSTKPLGTTPPS